MNLLLILARSKFNGSMFGFFAWWKAIYETECRFDESDKEIIRTTPEWPYLINNHQYLHTRTHQAYTAQNPCGIIRTQCDSNDDDYIDESLLECKIKNHKKCFLLFSMTWVASRGFLPGIQALRVVKSGLHQKSCDPWLRPASAWVPLYGNHFSKNFGVRRPAGNPSLDDVELCAWFEIQLFQMVGQGFLIELKISGSCNRFCNSLRAALNNTK